MTLVYPSKRWSTRGDIITRFLPAFAVLTLAALLPSRSLGADAPADAARPESVLARCSKILKYGDLHHASDPTKIDAVHALGLFGDASAVPLLVEHLQNEKSDHLRLQIVRALGWIGSDTAVPALESALGDKYPFVRQQSASALKKITGKEYDYDKTGFPSREQLAERMEKLRGKN